MTGVLVGDGPDDLRARARRLAERTGSNPDPDRAREERPAWIIGTIEQAAEQLAELRDLGLSRVMLQNLLHADLDVIALIGRDLAPRVA
jgi:alkanesulfonate monooxygenase SsuD/methylene tetrahydromethanopterin reductase-like flavin-dependent oxidoreductase (luciferase family)